MKKKFIIVIDSRYVLSSWRRRSSSELFYHVWR